MVNRVLRDDPYKSSMHNRQGLHVKEIWEAICDWGMWPIYALGLTHMSSSFEPSGGIYDLLLINPSSARRPTTAIPYALIAQPRLLDHRHDAADDSERGDRWWYDDVLRVLLRAHQLASPFDGYPAIMGAPAIVGTLHVRQGDQPVGLLRGSITHLRVPVHPSDSGAYCSISCLCLVLNKGIHRLHGSLVCLVACEHVQSARVFTTCTSKLGTCPPLASELLTCLTRLPLNSAIIYANIYRKDDAPLYKRGNRVLIGITCMNIFLYVFAFLFYRTLNARRDKIWNAWTKEVRFLLDCLRRWMFSLTRATCAATRRVSGHDEG